MVYRVLEEKDIDAIKELIKDCSPFLGCNGTYTYWMLADIYKGYSYIAEDEGILCGFITALPVPDQDAVFIWQLGVSPSRRKQGIAYQLVERAFEKAREKGYGGIITGIDARNIGSLSTFGKLAGKYGLKSEKIGKFTADYVEEDVYKYFL